MPLYRLLRWLPMLGHATPEGTARYRNRFPNLRDARHFRRPEQVLEVRDLWLSSIALGTYLGEPDNAADTAYSEAIAAYGLPNQGAGKERMSLLAAASRLAIAVMGSATLHQGRLVRGLPDVVGRVLGMTNDAENAIQFSRSTPGMTTSLIGMGHKEHVASNLKPALVHPTPSGEWEKLFTQR